MIYAPSSNLQGILDPQGSTYYSHRSLTTKQAAGNALAPGFINRDEVFRFYLNLSMNVRIDRSTAKMQSNINPTLQLVQ
jgi:hypothetical protein